MKPAERANILNHLAQVNHNSFAGLSIRTFIQSAQQHTDEKIFQCIREIKDQIRDNREAMKRVLGNQYDFINRFKIPEHETCHQA